MNIIKRGKDSGPKIFRFERPECGCVIEEEEEGCNSVAFEGVKYFYYLACPECGKECAIIDLSGKRRD